VPESRNIAGYDRFSNSLSSPSARHDELALVLAVRNNARMAADVFRWLVGSGACNHKKVQAPRDNVPDGRVFIS
jgi:hypothetical protein